MVQWLRLCASTAGGTGLIPGRGLRSCMPHGKAKNKKQKTTGLKALVSCTWHITHYYFFPLPPASAILQIHLEVVMCNFKTFHTPTLSALAPSIHILYLGPCDSTYQDSFSMLYSKSVRAPSFYCPAVELQNFRARRNLKSSPPTL